MSKKSFCTAIFAVATAVSTMAPVLADPTDDLKAEVKVLEARIKHLETQTGETPLRTPGLAPPTAGAAGPGATGTTAGDGPVTPGGTITPGQRQQLPAAQPAPQPDDVVRGGAFPGSFRLPGSNTSLAFHGWISLQSFYDPQQYLGDKFQVGSIIPNGNAQRGTAGTWHDQAKLTRIIFETRTPTHYGLFKTYFASDFYGFENGGSVGQQAIQNNNYGFRPVHIYGQLGGFLAGKTWSNFIDDPDSLESLDNAGASGVPSEQVPQIRYTTYTKYGNFAVSAETPVTDYATNDKVGNTELASHYGPTPDFTAKYEVEKKWGHAQVSGVLRKLAYDDGAGHRSTAQAGGAIAGFTVNLPKHSALGSQVWFGNGIMKFTPDDFGPVSSAQINFVGTPQQTLIPSNENGLTIYAAHTFSPQVRSNVGFGYNSMHWNDFIPADNTQPTTTHTLHANVIWSPVQMADFGFEYIHGLKSFREILNLPETSADRYEAAFKYRF